MVTLGADNAEVQLLRIVTSIVGGVEPTATVPKPSPGGLTTSAAGARPVPLNGPVVTIPPGFALTSRSATFVPALVG